jgi:hypothetical protein
MLRRSAAALVSLVAIGCTPDPYANLPKPRSFFEQEQVGSAQDYALIKWNDPDDHVATAHGFADDGEGCWLMAEGLNRNACAETDGRNCRNPFSCVPIVPRD